MDGTNCHGGPDNTDGTLDGPGLPGQADCPVTIAKQQLNFSMSESSERKL
jgi:hypothetical protein